MLTLLTLHSPGANVLLASDWSILMTDVGHDSRSTMRRRSQRFRYVHASQEETTCELMERELVRSVGWS